jgi:hypothetical protein
VKRQPVPSAAETIEAIVAKDSPTISNYLRALVLARPELRAIRLLDPEISGIHSTLIEIGWSDSSPSAAEVLILLATLFDPTSSFPRKATIIERPKRRGRPPATRGDRDRRLAEIATEYYDGLLERLASYDAEAQENKRRSVNRALNRKGVRGQIAERRNMSPEAVRKAVEAAEKRVTELQCARGADPNHIQKSAGFIAKPDAKSGN